MQQYPIFPWILKNYTTETLNFKDIKATFRDLKKPIGALNEERLKEFKEKYEEMKKQIPKPEVPPFMYGTHYSGSVAVLNYLIRVEPITSLCIKLQNGKFDEADRIFGSIEELWNNVFSCINDVKELIPEFFYCPFFVKNM